MTTDAVAARRRGRADAAAAPPPPAEASAATSPAGSRSPADASPSRSSTASDSTAGAAAPPRPRRTVAVLAGGTRGDAQPALAIAAALARRGHRVRVAVDAAFAPLAAACVGSPAAAAGCGVREAGGRFAVPEVGGGGGEYEFFPLAGDARAMMAATVEWGGMLPTSWAGMAWLRGEVAAIADSVWEALTAPWLAAAAPRADSELPPPPPAWRAAGEGSAGSDGDGGGGGGAPFRPELVVANQLAWGAVHCAEALGADLHVIYTTPWLPTAELPHPWARAWGRSWTDWAVAAATAAATPAGALLALVPGGGAARGAAARAALPRIVARANAATFYVLDHTAWWGVADIMVRLRRRLGLPLLARGAMSWALYRTPSICLWSPSLLPKPSDWGPQVEVVGFVHPADGRHIGSASNGGADDGGTDSDGSDASGGDEDGDGDGSGSYRPPRRLLDFLSSPGSEAPIYVGLGSCVLGGGGALAALASTVARAAGAAGVRVVLAAGWAGGGACAGAGGGLCGCSGGGGGRSGEQSGGSSGCAGCAGCWFADGGGRVLCVPEAPHDFLCLAVCHHGGIGTVAAGLAAGRPTLVLPGFGDLFANGELCHRLGVGPPPLPLADLSAPSLAAALRALACGARPGGRYAGAAASVAARLRRERGLEGAVDSLLRRREVA
ncbi:sterol 3-beta-glucosyltransferase [Raphidocelis subcapitata]|uniref:Sterol 3-beta-glucosyltransferase n=1 Tax=Raphidocelis subcapitata TaxID=307507 RepID=A0A2V0NXY4_9CHLO|nr:sterol 3-beta-glucosyltransferase [Raphidocelis subcapitata]|eukprot:GBF90440.1 sterol 3-beta-glucosyltransferase [Raphidocelis subcapitata]